MTEQECLSLMIPPGARKKRKYLEGVIQILVTRACDNSCFACTQGSNLAGKPMIMSPEHFEIAVKSLIPYHGVVGVFGGNPAMNPKFPELCAILRKHVPKHRRGLWCNNPLTEENGRAMRETFDPSVSNLNCHLSQTAYDNFKRWWPESQPFGVNADSRHAPVHLAMRDVLHIRCIECRGKGHIGTTEAGTHLLCQACKGTGKLYDESKAWELISNCDINREWSALIGVFRGEVRAWFCEVAGAQAMLHEGDPDYPDTGVVIEEVDGQIQAGYKFVHKDETGNIPWWKFSMSQFAGQVRKHCHECAVPLRGYGELAMGNDGTEQTSETHASVFKPKRKDRKVEIVTELIQLGDKRVAGVHQYLQNAKK